MTVSPVKIVADNAIPFLRGVLEPYGEIVYMDGCEISREDVLDADVLLTRTRTRCDSSLLGGSRVKLIATATIGTDHVDIPWCKANGIRVESAAGCNALAVADYVAAAITALDGGRFAGEGRTLGIVGVGHVGSEVEKMALKAGFRLLRCDPPRALREGTDGFCDLRTLLARSDIVTLHVPLDGTTRSMAGNDFFAAMKYGAVFINASRGEVVDEAALKAAAWRLGPLVIDTWCHEPEIDRELLRRTAVATPHIAGYSLQGKMNGTASVVRSVAAAFGIGALTEFRPDGWKAPVKISCSEISGKYPILADDKALRDNPDGFERLRREYALRDEFYI